VLRRTLFHTWRLFALLLLLLALLVSAARFGVPWLQAQRQALLNWLIADPALESQVDSLGARWTDFGPAIALKGLSLQQKNREPWQLQVQDATLQLDLWQSLSQRQWIIGELQFQGVTLILPQRLLRSPEGESQSSQEWQPLSRLLLGGLKQFELRDSRLLVRSSVGDLGSLSISRLRWQNRGSRHRGDGELALHHNGITHQIRLIADFNGPAESPAALNGQLYLASNSQRPQSPASSAAGTSEDDVQGQLGFEFWLQRQANNWQLGLLKVGDNQLQWQQADGPHHVALRGGVLQWQRLDAGWQLASHDLEVQGDDSNWRPWRMQVDAQAGVLSGRIDPVSLPAITPVLALLAGEHSVSRQALGQMKPVGTLEQLAFQRRDSDGHWQLSGQLQDLGWHRWEMVPGLQQVNGDFVLDDQRGRVNVRLGAQVVQVGPYFPADIPLTSLSGQLQWQQTAQGWQLGGQQLHLVTPALQADTDFRLDLPSRTSPYLALVTRVDLADAAQAWRYYPRLAMGQGLTDYLRAALQGGHAEGATVLWDGPLAEFPYHQGGGIFQAWVPLRQATFQFDPAWQPLKEMSLDLLFQNDTLEMRSQSARLGQAHSNHIHAWFPTLEPHSRLYINAGIQGEAKAVSDYLQDSGVKDSVGAALQDLRLSKPLTGDLQLVIPVDGDPVKVLGHVQFARNDLQIVSLGLPLEKVTGELFFTDAETRFSELNAELWGEPLRIDYLGTQQGDNYQVKLGLKGTWSQERARTLSAGWQQTFAGQADWTGSLALQLQPKGRYAYQAQWQSDLQGLGLNWPAPYSKVAKQAQPLRLTARGTQDSSTLLADWQNGLQFEGQLDPHKQQFTQFWVRNQDSFGGTLTPAPMNVDLKFEQLDADAWLGWWQTISQKTADVGMNRVANWLPPALSVQLRAKQMNWAQQPWENSSLQLHQEGQTGKATLLSNQVAGELVWKPKRPLAIELSHLHWRTANPASDARASPVLSLPEQQRQLAAIPSFDFHCQRCQLDDALLGEVKVSGRAVPQALLIPEFSLQSSGNRLTGQGSWRLVNGEGRSQLQANIQLASIESWLSDWHYAASVAGTEAKGALALNWLGPIYQPDIPSLSGTLNFETGKGLLRKLDSKGAQLLSVFSLNAIIRRLSLDFTDVFEKGFYFNSIRASGSISRGVLHSEDFELLGDAGDIRGKGKIDMPNKQLDFLFDFTPNLNKGVSLATAFAVTPVTGIYVLAASTLLSPVIDVFTRIQFHVMGPLGDPEVVEVGRERGQLKTIGDDYQKVLRR
jgi:uncharacterized protein (TIGR02099 family)